MKKRLDQHKAVIDYMDEKMITAVKEIVCNYYSLPIDNLLRHTRKREVTGVRHIALYFAVNNVNKRPSVIKKYFNCSHSSVYTTVKKINGFLDWDMKLKQEFAEIQYRIDKRLLLYKENVDINKSFYFVDMNNFISAKQDEKKAILFCGYSKSELQKILILDKSEITELTEDVIKIFPDARTKFMGPDLSKLRAHVETGMFVVEKNDVNT